MKRKKRKIGSKYISLQVRRKREIEKNIKLFFKKRKIISQQNDLFPNEKII